MRVQKNIDQNTQNFQRTPKKISKRQKKQIDTPSDFFKKELAFNVDFCNYFNKYKHYLVYIKMY